METEAQLPEWKQVSGEKSECIIKGRPVEEHILQISLRGCAGGPHQTSAGKKRKETGEKSEVLIRSDALSSGGNHLSSNMKYSFLGLFALLGFICAQVKKQTFFTDRKGIEWGDIHRA